METSDQERFEMEAWCDWACGNCSRNHVKWKAARLGYIKGREYQRTIDQAKIDQLKEALRKAKLYVLPVHGLYKEIENLLK